MQEPTRWSATRTTLVYVAVATGWIVVSTQLAFGEGGIAGLPPRIVELVKGLLFVAVSGAALWVVTHRFERDLRASEARRRELLQERLDVADRTRQRLARDVQEDAVQLLAAAGIRLDAATASGQAAEMRRARALLDGGVNSLRRIVLELEPPELTPGNLEGIIAAYSSLVLDPTVDREMSIVLPRRVHDQVLAAAYRILVEAVSNAARHAEPQRVSIVVTVINDSVVGRVVDDGRGLPPETTGDGGNLGLRSMRERAVRLGGTVTVGTHGEDGGTIVRFSLPIDAPPSDEEIAADG